MKFLAPFVPRGMGLRYTFCSLMVAVGAVTLFASLLQEDCVGHS